MDFMDLRSQVCSVVSTAVKPVFNECGNLIKYPTIIL